MDFPEGLEKEIEFFAEAEVENPTNDFGDRLYLLVFDRSNEELSDTLIHEFNNWQEFYTEEDCEKYGISWGDFIRWCWMKIKAWWKSLWD